MHHAMIPRRDLRDYHFLSNESQKVRQYCTQLIDQCAAISEHIKLNDLVLEIISFIPGVPKLLFLSYISTHRTSPGIHRFLLKIIQRQNFGILQVHILLRYVITVCLDLNSFIDLTRDIPWVDKSISAIRKTMLATTKSDFDAMTKTTHTPAQHATFHMHKMLHDIICSHRHAGRSDMFSHLLLGHNKKTK